MGRARDPLFWEGILKEFPHHCATRTDDLERYVCQTNKKEAISGNPQEEIMSREA